MIRTLTRLSPPIWLIMCMCVWVPACALRTGPAQQQKNPTPDHAPRTSTITVDQIDQNQDGLLDATEIQQLTTPTQTTTWAFTSVMLVMIVTFVACWWITRPTRHRSNTPDHRSVGFTGARAERSDDWLDTEQDFLGTNTDADQDHWLDSGQSPDK